MGYDNFIASARISHDHDKGKSLMKVLLLEIPSADHAFKGWLAGSAIREVFNLLNIENTYKLILSKRFLTKAIKDISDYDVLHIECHSDKAGICYNPLRTRAISWEDFAEKLTKTNELKKKQLVISGCLAGSINSKAKVLAKKGSGFKRVFAFEEEIEYDKVVAVWSGFYYLLSKAEQWSPREVRTAIKKLRECYDVGLRYFYPSSSPPSGVRVFPKEG